LWADGVKYKKPVRLSAPEYVDKLFDWVEAQVRQLACHNAGLWLSSKTVEKLGSQKLGCQKLGKLPCCQVAGRASACGRPPGAPPNSPVHWRCKGLQHSQGSPACIGQCRAHMRCSHLLLKGTCTWCLLCVLAAAAAFEPHKPTLHKHPGRASI
jgi:hypothetical protein